MDDSAQLLDTAPGLPRWAEQFETIVDWALPRPRLRVNTLLLVVTGFITLTQNGVLWRHVLAAFPPQPGMAEFGLLATLLLGVEAVLLLVVLPLSARWLVRPLLAALLLVTAACSYFADAYGVVVDQAMVGNLLQTDRAELGELLTLPLFEHLLVQGVLPAWLVLRTTLVAGGPAREVGRRALLLVLSLVVLGTSVLANYKQLLLWGRSHRDLRMYVIPAYPLDSVVKHLLPTRNSTARPFAAIATDAHRMAGGRRPRLLVLVVGETARAANFQLAGYARPTNPGLAALPDVVSFGNVRSCGTATAISLPCMFSRLGRQDFSRAAAAAEENVLDVLQRTGVAVQWHDNNSGCKGVCSRVPTTLYRELLTEVDCTNGLCHDGILLRNAAFATDGASTGDRLVVLHLAGSHGPAYYRRYPPEFRRFVPDCSRDDVQSCSKEAIVNAYDNSMLYTDHVLAQLIAHLPDHSTGVDAALVYVSDHGESLGENGLYLHGLPWGIAPREQKHIPFVVAAPFLDTPCLRGISDKAYSHDNLFPLLLGFFSVATREYVAAADPLAACDSRANLRPTI